MRSKSSIISSILFSCFLCGHSMAMQMEAFEYGKDRSFTKANVDAFKTFVSTFEKRESEEAKHIDEQGNFLIDYARMRVCDVRTVAAPHYSQVLNEISPLFEMVYPSQLIVMNFEGNYLQDEGVSALVDFVLEHSLLKERLKKIDLSNNRFGVLSLPKLKSLVEQCAHLEKLDISINLIGVADVNQAFQELSADKKRVVRFSPY